MRRKVLLPVLVLMLYAAIPTTGNAQQCHYYSINLNNDTTVTAVSCDFPEKGKTADALADQNQFVQQFHNWRQGKPGILISPVTSGVSQVFFLVSQSTFDLFSEERKAALRLYPDLYRISL